MNRTTVLWCLVLVLSGGFLAYRAATVGNGRVYVRRVHVKPEVAVEPQAEQDRSDAAGPEAPQAGPPPEWDRYEPALRSNAGEKDVMVSVPRTIGVWLAALLSLCILSFLWGDNPLYKLAESIFVGVSAGYAMVVGFWTGIVQNLLAKIIPDLMRQSFLPALEGGPDFVYLVPLVLSVMMLMRLSPVGSWIARWPLAFFIGATAGIRLLGYFESDFLRQIESTIVPLVVMTDAGVSWADTLKNITVTVGVLTCLVYFFFSVEHRGVAGVASRVGIWFLMITFGAGFGYTVMGRIALIAERLNFLFIDWLWLDV